MPLKLSQSPERGYDGPGGDRNQNPIRVNRWSWLRVALGALFFGAGCLLAYRTELRGYGLKGSIAAYILVVVGLVVGLWGVLWS